MPAIYESIPEEPTAEQIQDLMAACPPAHHFRRPGPWGSTIITRCYCGWGPHRRPPDWLDDDDDPPVVNIFVSPTLSFGSDGKLPTG